MIVMDKVNLDYPSFVARKSEHQVTVEWDVPTNFQDVDAIDALMDNPDGYFRCFWSFVDHFTQQFSLPSPYIEQRCGLAVRFDHETKLVFVALISGTKFPDDIKTVFTFIKVVSGKEFKQTATMVNQPNKTNGEQFATGITFDPNDWLDHIKFRCDIVYTKRDTDRLGTALKEAITAGFGDLSPLQVQGQILDVHEKILIRHSVVIKEMFEENRAQSALGLTYGAIMVDGVSFEVMHGLIFAMFAGRVDFVDFDFTIELIHAANQLKVLAIVEQCEPFLCQMLSEDKILKALDVVTQIPAYSLFHACETLLRKMHPHKVFQLRKTEECIKLEGNYYIKDMMKSITKDYEASLLNPVYDLD